VKVKLQLGKQNKVASVLNIKPTAVDNSSFYYFQTT